jgi:hypothetical protein
LFPIRAAARELWRNLDGYLNKFEITYQPGFDINQFNVEPGYEYNAVVNRI